MVDWVTIATTAVGILMPFVKKAGEKAAEKVGEAIFNLIKDKFKGNEEAESTLKNFKRNPNRYKAALADILAEKAETDPEFGTALQGLVEGARERTTTTGNVTQIAQGEGIMQTAGTGAFVSVATEHPLTRRRRRKKK